MSTLQERFALAIKHYENTSGKRFIKAHLADYCGVSRPAVSEWIDKNVQTLEQGNAEKAAAFLGVNHRWLNGLSSLMLDNVDKQDGLTPFYIHDANTPLQADEVEIDFYGSLRVACGNGSMVEVLESEKSKLRIPRKTLDDAGVYRDSVFAAPAEDDSMKPKIDDGDIVYADRRRNTIKNNRIFVIEHGGLYRCKRLFELPDGGVRIVSDNKEEYDEERLTAQQIIDQRFRIVGWVWKIDKMEKW